MASKIKKGSIVVVIEGRYYGNKPGSIVKVLAKPGILCDGLSSIIGKRHAGKTVSVSHTNRFFIDLVLCEKSNRVYSGKPPKTYLNKPCRYETITDLRPATEEEKALYRKSKK